MIRRRRTRQDDKLRKLQASGRNSIDDEVESDGDENVEDGEVAPVREKGPNEFLLDQ